MATSTRRHQVLHENVGFKVAAARVTAVTRHGGSPDQIGRRSEIGSHALPRSAFFIHGGELEKVMWHFYKMEFG